MNIDPELLSQLSEIDPKELSDKISAVSALLGMDAEAIKSIIGTPQDIRKKLQGLSEKELKDITEKIDPALIQKLNQGDK